MAMDYMGDDMFKETLMVHGWPECGPGSISVEAMYQVFKARLMRELVARENITHDSHYDVPLADATAGRGGK